MSAPWQITSGTVSPGAQATASQAPATNASTSGMVTRLRSICATLGGVGNSAAAVLVICDGASALSATAIWQMSLSAASGDNAIVQLTGLDIRASAGNSLTVGFIAGGGGSITQSVNATGDFVQVGAPAFTPNC